MAEYLVIVCEEYTGAGSNTHTFIVRAEDAEGAVESAYSHVFQDDFVMEDYVWEYKEGQPTVCQTVDPGLHITCQPVSEIQHI